MTETIGAQDPRHRLAVNTFRDKFGLSIPDVLLPTMWCVMEVDGEPKLMLNADGMRALALTTPRPDAPQLAEKLIASSRRNAAS